LGIAIGPSLRPGGWSTLPSLHRNKYRCKEKEED